jgi:hypothetical protein
MTGDEFQVIIFLPSTWPFCVVEVQKPVMYGIFSLYYRKEASGGCGAWWYWQGRCPSARGKLYGERVVLHLYNSGEDRSCGLVRSSSCVGRKS